MNAHLMRPHMIQSGSLITVLILKLSDKSDESINQGEKRHLRKNNSGAERIFVQYRSERGKKRARTKGGETQTHPIKIES